MKKKHFPLNQRKVKLKCLSHKYGYTPLPGMQRNHMKLRFNKIIPNSTMAGGTLGDFKYSKNGRIKMYPHFFTKYFLTRPFFYLFCK